MSPIVKPPVAKSTETTAPLPLWRPAVFIHPARMDNPYMLVSSKASTRKRASRRSDAMPSFDLLAGIGAINERFAMDEAGESKVKSVKVPGFAFATYRRVHTAFIEQGCRIESGAMLSSCVHFFLELLMKGCEAQGLINALRDVETSDDLTPFQVALPRIR